jgi:hypothetical protein
MNQSKNHKKHIAYKVIYNDLEGEGSPKCTRLMLFYEMRKSRRKSMREIEKHIRSRAWQKRLWKQIHDVR